LYHSVLPRLALARNGFFGKAEEIKTVEPAKPTILVGAYFDAAQEEIIICQKLVSRSWRVVYLMCQKAGV